MVAKLCPNSNKQIGFKPETKLTQCPLCHRAVQVKYRPIDGGVAYFGRHYYEVGDAKT